MLVLSESSGGCQGRTVRNPGERKPSSGASKERQGELSSSLETGQKTRQSADGQCLVLLSGAKRLLLWALHQAVWLNHSTLTASHGHKAYRGVSSFLLSIFLFSLLLNIFFAFLLQIGLSTYCLLIQLTLPEH